MAHAARQRSAAKRDQERVQLVSFEELEADGPGSLARRYIQAVLYEVGAALFGHPAGQQAGVLNVVTFEPDGRTEGLDARDLARVGGLRRNHCDGDPALR